MQESSVIRVPELSFADDLAFYVRTGSGYRTTAVQQVSKAGCYPKRIELLGCGENARHYALVVKTKALIDCRVNSEVNRVEFTFLKKGTFFGSSKKKKREAITATYDVLGRTYGSGLLMVAALLKDISFVDLYREGRCLRVREVILLKNSLEEVQRIWKLFWKVVDYCAISSRKVVRAVSLSSDSESDSYPRLEDCLHTRDEIGHEGFFELEDAFKEEDCEQSESFFVDERQERIDSVREILKEASVHMPPEVASLFCYKLECLERDSQPASLSELSDISSEMRLTSEEIKNIWNFVIKVDRCNESYT